MNTDSARVQMVSQQVRTWAVLDPRVLEAMTVVSRQHFVPDAFSNVAFADSRIPLPHGQVMLAPKVVGRIAQGLTLRPQDRVLEIGTGSGYLTTTSSSCSSCSSQYYDPTASSSAKVMSSGTKELDYGSASLVGYLGSD